MAERMSAPFGDIFLVNTPTIDRWGQQLYAEQKMREARAQQENTALDANLQKELGKVRSVDTPDVINSYQQYKNLKKELMFNKSLQNDPVAYNKAQQAANVAYQNIFSTANKSSEINDMQKQLTAGYLKNPNEHADDFGVRMNTLMNTPIGQLGTPHPQLGNLTDWDSYMDRGINTDFGKMMREAVGSPKPVYSVSTPLPGGLQTQVTPYNYANTPAQVKDYLVGSMGMRQAGKDAAKLWDRLPESEIDNTIKQYQSLPKEYWQKMGLSSPQDLFPKNPDNKAENYAAYQSMKYALANEPKAGKPDIIENKKAVEDLKFEREKAMEGIKQGNRQDLERLKKSLKPSDTEMNNVWYQSYLDKLMNEAKGGERHNIYIPGGKSLYYYNMVNPDPLVMKSFSRNGVEPDRIGVTEDGKIAPIFFKYEKDAKGNEVVKTQKSGNPIVDEELSRPMSYEQALTNIGFRGTTKKQLGKDLSGNVQKTYLLEGKHHTHKELNDMGYDDETINKAIKAGILK